MVTAVAHLSGLNSWPRPSDPTAPWEFQYEAWTTQSDSPLVADGRIFNPNDAPHKIRTQVEAEIKEQLVASNLMLASDDVFVFGL